jgi:outer membrane lipoprotein SlyB
MKKILQYSLLTALLVISSFVSVNAQPHPGEQNNSGSLGGGRIGDAPAGAPVGNGTFILFALALAYAGRKVYGMRETAEE